MLSTILLGLVALVAWKAYATITNLRRYIASAKSTGLPYYVVPLNPIFMLSQLTVKIWLPLWRLLPRKYWDPASFYCEPNWLYTYVDRAYANGDSFIIVTPWGLQMHTADADVIHQITSQREKFPKPLENYGVLTLFGENVVTTEGAVWRMHRKITSASFNEKNSALVFKVATVQAQGMLDFWHRERDVRRITTLEQDTMTLALNIIGYVGFGLRLLWSGQRPDPDTDPRLLKYASLDVPPGHTLSFKDSISEVLHHLLPLLALPTFLLENLPFRFLRDTVRARDNFNHYMAEFIQDKAEDVRAGNNDEGMDIMGSLVATSYGDRARGAGGSKAAAAVLEDSEIIGNAFIMFLAGHETSANVIHFTMLQLANNPAAQRQLQRDVDAILGDRDPATWDYDESVNAMMASMLGACMNETLRTMPPVTGVPKKVAEGAQPAAVVTSEGERHLIPAGTHISLHTVGVQSNPRYWPTKPSAVDPSRRPDDLLDWVPERWYRASKDSKQQKTKTPAETVIEGADTEDFGGFAGPDTSAQLFRPHRGSYIPFSDGARSCLGRRIAQVEIIAALAVIFQRYSVENAVDEWVSSDAEIDAMSREEKSALYARATARSRNKIAGASAVITLKFQGGEHVPVRLVRRGEERFINWIDA